MKSSIYLENINTFNVYDVDVFKLLFDNREKFIGLHYLNESIAEYLIENGFIEYFGFFTIKLEKKYFKKDNSIYIYREGPYNILVNITHSFMFIYKENDLLQTLIDFEQKLCYIRYNGIETNSIDVFKFDYSLDKKEENFGIATIGEPENEKYVPKPDRDIEYFRELINQIIQKYMLTKKLVNDGGIV